MKPLKILSLAAVAAAALLAFAGIGAASATVLCKNNSGTSSCSETYGSGQVLEASLSGTSALESGGTTLDTCTGGTVKAKTTNAGGTSETVKANVETLSWSGCSKTTDTLKNGSLEIHWISGTDNGTLTAGSSEWTINSIFGTCTYGFGTSTDLGTITGGNPATISISATVSKISGSFACPSTALWTASYTFTEPKPLYVGSAASSATSTSLTTSLSGEEKAGEEITVNEGSKVKDTATLSGTNASKATGTVKYKVYADKECKELVTGAGEVTVTSGSVPASEEKELEAGRVYYWQAEYSGDSNNLGSTSACGKEILTVEAETTLTTTLYAEEGEELIEGEEINVFEGTTVKGKPVLGGTNDATATGTVTYQVYADNECEELVAEAGEVSVEVGEVPFSKEVELEEGTYYWRAQYSGDALHQASESTCANQVLNVMPFETFHSSAPNPNVAVGKQIENQVFEFAGGNQVACKSATYLSQEFNSPALFINVEPSYTECTGLGAFKKQEVKSEGCVWTLTARIYSVKLKKNVDKTFLKCPEGQKLKILALDDKTNAIKCEVTMAGQEANVVMSQSLVIGMKQFVAVFPDLGNLTYNVTETGADCNLPQEKKGYGGGKLTGSFELEVKNANLTIK